MPKIEFRGKTYNSEFEMPPDVRQAYNEEKERSAEKSGTSAKSLTDVVEMSPEMKEIYERAVEKVDEKPVSSQPLNELPKTEDIYRQSAPEDMRDLPSDESVYRPSQPIIDPMKPTIEPESGLGMNRLIASVIWVLILIAIAFFIIRYIL
jgi:hypothetical protein